MGTLIPSTTPTAVATATTGLAGRNASTRFGAGMGDSGFAALMQQVGSSSDLQPAAAVDGQPAPATSPSSSDPPPLTTAQSLPTASKGAVVPPALLIATAGPTTLPSEPETVGKPDTAEPNRPASDKKSDEASASTLPVTPTAVLPVIVEMQPAAALVVAPVLPSPAPGGEPTVAATSPEAPLVGEKSAPLAAAASPLAGPAPASDAAVALPVPVVPTSSKPGAPPTATSPTSTHETPTHGDDRFTSTASPDASSSQISDRDSSKQSAPSAPIGSPTTTAQPEPNDLGALLATGLPPGLTQPAPPTASVATPAPLPTAALPAPIATAGQSARLSSVAPDSTAPTLSEAMSSSPAKSAAETMQTAQVGPSDSATQVQPAPLVTSAATTSSLEPARPAQPTPASHPVTAQVAQAIVEPVKVVMSSPAQPGPTIPHITTIQITPGELGRVEVRIERTLDGPAKIQLVAERQETLTRLVHDQSQLHQALDQAGIPSTGRTIDFSLAPPPPSASPSTSFGNTSAGNNPSGNEYRSQNGPYATQLSQGAENDDSVVSSRIQTFRTGIDITA